MAFSDKLVELARPCIEAQLQKPFLVGIVNGDLPLDKFQYWLKVDYPYLIHYTKILALGITKADSFETMQILARLMQGTIDEMSLHESYAAKYGVSRKNLIEQKMGPVKYSYTRHELAAAYSGSLGELLAALLPCMWGYGEVARLLVNQRPIEPENPYKDWLAYYSAEEFGRLGTECLHLVDGLVPACTQGQLKKMEENYVISCHYEVMCWDAYYNKEEWVIG